MRTWRRRRVRCDRSGRVRPASPAELATVGLVAIALVGAGCASDDESDDTAAASDAPPASDESDTGGDDVFSGGSTEIDPALGPVTIPPPTAEGDTAPGPVESIEPVPVPDTGVPGIDSSDAFCRSWSEFAGSYQALSFSWFAQTADDAARLEAAASDVLLAAADGLAEYLPAELEGDRQALTVDLTAPISRRAEVARAALVDAGLDDEQIARLGELWLAAIVDQGVQSETLAIDPPDELAPALDTAATEVAAALPSIVEDPSLIVDVDISASETYLFENCPDRGTLGGNDVVG